MNQVRVAALNVMNRIVRSAGGESCQLHRVYKISFSNGSSYVGQTKRLPHDRVKEHARISSKCTRVVEEMRKQTPFSIETLVVTGGHNIHALEKVAIVIENTLVTHGGLNIAIGGPGVKKANDEYEKFANEIRMLYAKMAKGHNISYDMMFMRGDTCVTETEFDALKFLMKARESR
jgi:hypothetical protein